MIETSLVSSLPESSLTETSNTSTLFFRNGTFSKENRPFSSGMTGTLAQMPPVELFQTLNYNQKTGILKMNLPEGPALFAFRGGDIVKAEYGSDTGKNAFFSILGEKEGRFHFVPGLPDQDMTLPELGMFMELLMEGLRKLDEITSV